uniref:Uncharacterized protein n=1 Tax=Romanomermis culicivorax TaxID=13658 RepID=A0A915KF83_ROMCU
MIVRPSAVFMACNGVVVTPPAAPGMRMPPGVMRLLFNGGAEIFVADFRRMRNDGYGKNTKTTAAGDRRMKHNSKHYVTGDSSRRPALTEV